MGHMVRSAAHYDRVWVPGASRDNANSGSKIEYLEERRRQKAAALKPDTLQYDFNFNQTAAAHGDRNAKVRYMDTSSQRRSTPGRPQGVGGRKQTQPQVKRAPAKQQSARQAPADKRQERPAGSPTKAKNAPRQNPGAKKHPAKPKQNSPKPQPKNGKRPQRDTVTDFHSVRPQKEASQKNAKPAAKTGSSTGRNGHGRKLTPTYELKHKGPSGYKHGAPVMEGGVLGFDMGTYADERPVENKKARSTRSRSLISTIITIAVVFMLLCVPLALQARISDYSQRNTSLEKDIALLEEEISKLKMEVALQEDLGNIQERASALGMAHPQDTQIEYVDLESTDVVNESTPMQQEVEKEVQLPVSEPGILDTIGSWLSSLFRGDGEIYE